MSSQSAFQVIEGLRLSPQQRRLWQFQESHAGQPFAAQCTLLLTGRLDADRLARAVASVGARHEILRTSFGFLEGTAVPVQIVNGAAPALAPIIDLSGLDAQQKHVQAQQIDAQVQQIKETQWDRLRDFPNTPAWSFALLRLNDAQHLLIVTAAGLCADAAAVVNVIKEMRSEYDGGASAAGEPLQYADLAEWQNQLLEEPGTPDHSPYWSAPEFLKLPFPRLPFELSRQTVNAGSSYQDLTRTLPEKTCADLAAWARRAELPVSAVLLAVWQLLLGRFAGIEQFLLGVELNGRIQEELHDAIGAFSRVLPIRADIDHSRFLESAKRIAAAVEIAGYDQLMFDCKVFPGNLARRHFYPVIFSSRELPSLQPVGPLTWEIKSALDLLEPHDLSVTVMTGTGGTQLRFSWDSSVFSLTDIELLSASYISLLEKVIANPDSTLDSLAIEDSSAMQWRSGLSEDASWPTLVELFAEQVRRVPGQTAVTCEGWQITYLELDQQSSTLAQKLRHAGAVPDSVVALIAERSVNLVVGILAIVKAGAAWLPIEPDTPPQRAEYMLRQARAVAVLTQPSFTASFQLGELPVVHLDDPVIADEAVTALPNLSVHPHQLAYVIFTSGSTGQPKGVAVEHRQVASYVHALLERVKPQHNLHFALVSTPAADLGHTSLFAALSCGGCLHVIPAWRASDMEALAQYFLAHPVDFVKIVPAHLEALCRSLPEGAQLPWKQLLVGGELFSWKLLEQVKRVAPGCAVFNHYGPTETTVGVFCGPASLSLERFTDANIPVGRPFAGVAAYLLDKNMRPVSTWMTGELYIGGGSVARGYTGQGDLTAERFLPDPFSPLPGSRMYRTGDLARWRSDGPLQILGRSDGQIKIRGYRVEIGEVEAALCRHPEVGYAAVIVVDQPEGKSLRAFAAIGETRVAPDDLRIFLAKSLPPHMVPASIVCVKHLKLTPNGKVDRQALPAVSAASASAMYSGPTNEVEESLAAVFRKVLARERVGVDDNYFAIGGDSLRVVQIVHEARNYGIAIGATDVLRHQTIRKLGNALHSKAVSGLFPDGVPALPPPSAQVLQHLPADVVDIYPLSGMQRYVIQKYVEDHERVGVYHIQESIHASDPGFSLPALKAALRAVVDRHPALRTVMDMESDPPMQWVRRELQCQEQVEDISHLSASEQEDHISAALRADRARPFNLDDRSSPLFRVSIFLRSATDFEWVFSCHHAIMDGWGHRVLLNQLVQSYLAIKSGKKAELGTPDSSYREFVAFQEAVRSLDKARDFWRSYLAGMDAPAFSKSAHASDIPPEEARAVCPLEPSFLDDLSSTAQKSAVSMQSLFLAAWFETLRGLHGSRQVITGVVTNGRSEYLSDPLSGLGLFWNIVPVASSAALPVLEQATAVQKHLIEMEPYSACPLPQILADQGKGELFFSSFRYLNFWNMQQAPDGSGLRLLGMRAYDRYSFPLSCTASVNPMSGAGMVQLEYDPEYFTFGQIHAAIENFAALLKTAADS